MNESRMKAKFSSTGKLISAIEKFPTLVLVWVEGMETRLRSYPILKFF